MILNAPEINALAGILVILALDLVLMVVVAVKNGTFNLSLLPQTLATNVLPYVGALVVLALAAAFSAGFTFQGVEIKPILEALYYGASAIYAPKLLLDVRDKVQALFGAGPVAARMSAEKKAQAPK